MPRTEAGKRLLAEFIDDENGMATFDVDTLADQIDAIEAEAREQGWNDGKEFGMQLGRSQPVASERARIRAAVEGLEPCCDESSVTLSDGRTLRAMCQCGAYVRDAVLSIIDAADPVTTQPADPSHADKHG